MADEQLSQAEEAFEEWRKRLGLPLALAAFFAVYVPCEGLTVPGRKLAGILAAIGVLWITEAIPLPASALFGAVLCVVLGVAEAKVVLASFADPIVFVYLGGFMLAAAMTVHGLDRRIALALLSVRSLSRSPARVMAALGLATAGISMWVSNTATTAMMLPIAIGILAAMHEARVARGEAAGPLDARTWPYAAGLMLMVAYGASIGGIGTPVGTPPNLIGIGLIEKTIGADIGFFRWMTLAMPLLVVMGAVLFVLLWKLHSSVPLQSNSLSSGPLPLVGRAGEGVERRPTPPHPSPTPSPSMGGEPKDEDYELIEYIRGQRAALGSWSRGEINTLIAFIVAIVLWVLPGVLELPWLAVAALAPLREWMTTNMPESIVALVAALLLFLLPMNLKRWQFTLTWRQAQAIDWGTILLFGGGMALGSLMFTTGVAEALGRGMADSLGVQSLWGLTGLSIAIAIVLSETASNTASANMVIPVAIAIAKSAGVSPLPPALGACLGASFGFMLPVSTPPNAIVYGSGLVPLKSMMRAGVIFDVVGFAIIWAGLRVLCPALGLM